ncbi:HypC/HybG/HupF family hydrogenase formation chaperone [Terasakiella pusilla]|jgi:hydrogenase expression/formation protein HypC|uniref:HypC/HybG/HupF family hydrogenase formation chaperone n=1 Tax=Terasakiella pusilla TaxID=64973 RepID=UPI00048E94C4|nr:HypC/HybG/HupF family hydrogenase formation chaperone [Terasakiella pusilla]
MCLAIPVEIVSIKADDETALVSLNGIKKEISIALVDDVEVGDFVLLHVGYALNKISPEEAERTLAIMAESGVIEQTVRENLS